MSWNKDYQNRGKLWGGSVKDLPSLPSNSRVLEAGCGNGKTLVAMKDANWNAIGVDTSYSAIKLATKDGMTAVVGDICNLPFINNFFDAVFCWHLLDHLQNENIPIATKEMYRVIRDGGMVFCKVFSCNDMRYGKGIEIEKDSFLRGNGIYTHYFHIGELREIFQSIFHEESLTTSSWNMRIRGNIYHREEICGIFKKEE